MKKLLTFLFALLLVVISITSSHANSVTEFLNRDVSIDGHSVAGHLKMWQSIGLATLPFAVVGIVLGLAYIHYVRQEKRVLNKA